MLTLVAAALGGVIALLAQITLAYLQTRAGKRRKKEESEAAVRVIRFHFYASQRVLQASLETGLWWASEEGLNVAAAGEALNTLADLLPEEQWRTYTAAWRRLRGCIQRYNASMCRSGSNGSPRAVTEVPHGHNVILQPVEPADLKFLLGTFVTVDDARRQLEPYVRDRSTACVQLGQLRLTKQEIDEALEGAGHLVDQNRWRRILQSSEGIP